MSTSIFLSVTFCVIFLFVFVFCFFFFFNDTATTEIYTLSLHDALPIYVVSTLSAITPYDWAGYLSERVNQPGRSEEHTSELQSLAYLVCRLLLEKKKNTKQKTKKHIMTRDRSMSPYKNHTARTRHARSS